MAPSLLPPDVSPTLPSQQHWSPSTAGGHLSAQLRGELDELLAETRHRAILDALEAWRNDLERPREGVQALERMARAGVQLQRFDWPELSIPSSPSAGSSFVPAGLAAAGVASRLSIASAGSAASAVSGGLAGDALRSQLGPPPLSPQSVVAPRASAQAPRPAQAPAPAWRAPWDAPGGAPGVVGLEGAGRDGIGGDAEAPRSAVLAVLDGFGPERRQQLLEELRGRIATGHC
mmetsp:Transcript_91913/g.297302  ORF Transcript_91913/g.297302 Transcript_91913/m.297302 type:complete len:233 (-) Transcript_91913:75-773(-)